jgi:hypothetical protein
LISYTSTGGKPLAKINIARSKKTPWKLLRSLVSFGALSASIGSLSAVGGDVHALFNLADPAIGPFPSDQFSVSDASQITGRRVALPKPDCDRQPSDCDDIAIINSLDGFNLQPRIAISFDGAIDVSSVTSKSVSLVEFGNPTPPRIIGINQIGQSCSAQNSKRPRKHLHRAELGRFGRIHAEYQTRSPTGLQHFP